MFKVKGTLLKMKVKTFEKGQELVEYGEYILDTDDHTFKGTCKAEIANQLLDYVGHEVDATFELYPDEKLKPHVRLLGVK